MIRTVPIRSYPLKILPRPPRKQPATTHSREILFWNRPTRQNHQTHMSVGSLIQKLLKLLIIDTTIMSSLNDIWLPQKKNVYIAQKHVIIFAACLIPPPSLKRRKESYIIIQKNFPNINVYQVTFDIISDKTSIQKLTSTSNKQLNPP